MDGRNLQRLGESYWRWAGVGRLLCGYDKATSGPLLHSNRALRTTLPGAGISPNSRPMRSSERHRAAQKVSELLKDLGLYLRAKSITSGKLVAVDDPRFDPMWNDACGQFDMPVAIHGSDPAAILPPTDATTSALRN